MRLLVVGGGGQLGSKLIAQAAESDDVYGTYMSREPRLQQDRKLLLDKCDKPRVLETVNRLQPEVIIDTAALHNVDYCESHREEAWRINVEGSRNLAEASALQGARIVYISTDYIFDGTTGNYAEEDVPKPVNYYGVTKVEAERAVSKANENHLIVRPALVYSWVNLASSTASASGKPLNFAMWTLQRLTKMEPVKIVDDQFASPTLADSLAETILLALKRNLLGVYHIAGRTRMNRYEFTLKLAEHLGLERSLISPTKTSELKQAARRPSDSSLDVRKIERDLQVTMPEIDEALEVFAGQAKEMTTP